MVLSGGGSSAIAHIGVLKALEEYGIPIDYITGTSMGALVGALYASGYSPDEIETIFLSDKFQDWANGNLDSKYVYFLRKKEDDASIITLKVALDSIWETSLPTNLISSAPVNYGLMEYLSPANALAKNNFDSLFVPFRCVTSDIISKKAINMSKGDLATSVRASVAYPFYLSPISLNNKLLFDGGLYNNFPSDIMFKDFMPDVIIGSNVSYNFDIPNEDNIVSQIKSIITTETNYSIPCPDNGIIIEPDAKKFSTFNFDNNEELIQIGYDATVTKIQEIYAKIKRRVSKQQIEQKRLNFKTKIHPLIINNIEVDGLKPSQNKYIKKSLNLRKNSMSAEKLRPQYIKVSSDDKIKLVYPTAFFDSTTNLYTLHLKAKKEKNLFASFGGLFSSRPINEGFVGLQYNLLSKVAVSILANSYFGKLHNSISTGFRIDFPYLVPFYLESTFNIDGWDYFRSKSTFFEDTKPAFLLIKDQYAKSQLSFPISYKGKLSFIGNFGELKNEYYQTKNFLSTDTTDLTRFKNYSTKVQFELNSLDQKQYATEGTYFNLSARYISGAEFTKPGSTSILKDEFRDYLSWFNFKIKLDKYFIKKGYVKFGTYIEGVYANQPFFNNYTATILSSPAFQPVSESVTLFQENFRAHTYVAGGIKNIYQILSNLQLRLEAYVFQPYQEILNDNFNKAHFGKAWATRQYIFSGALVYQTPLGPIALNLNYYDKTDNHWSFLFHFGYIIFNKKSLN